MTKHSGTLSYLIMGFILILGFQNCSNSKFSDAQLIQEAPLSSIADASPSQVSDTKYKNGFSFDYIEKNDFQTASQFKVQKVGSSLYSARVKDAIITCTLEDPNAMEELMQITEVITVSSPSLAGNIEVCNPIDGKFIHFKIGDTNPLFLIAKSQEGDCLVDDPQRLISENKKVFIVDNISYEEIESLVSESKNLSTGASCTVHDLSLD